MVPQASGQEPDVVGHSLSEGTGSDGSGITPALSDRDRAILGFERRWWGHGGAKEQSIRDEFGVSAARYYQLLGALVDSPAALVHDPMLVKRLQRMRDARSAARAARALTTRD
ncbi:MAG: DUF3263 domain-containing protein [Microbacteriaceae bacterium]